MNKYDRHRSKKRIKKQPKRGFVDEELIDDCTIFTNYQTIWPRYNNQYMNEKNYEEISILQKRTNRQITKRIKYKNI